MTIIEQIKQDVLCGKPIVIIDDSDREDEGDLVLAAEKVNQENLVFCMNNARGLMCIPCMQDRLDRLGIPMMPSNNRDTLQTPFACSVDAVVGTTTGMSVNDRLRTISVLTNDSSLPEELSYPGHLFPLRARQGLLTERRGHTESSVELVRSCGLKPIAVIIEIMNYDGTMTKGKQLVEFAAKHDLNIVSIQQIYDHVYNGQ